MADNLNYVESLKFSVMSMAVSVQRLQKEFTKVLENLSKAERSPQNRVHFLKENFDELKEKGIITKYDLRIQGKGKNNTSLYFADPIVAHSFYRFLKRESSFRSNKSWAQYSKDNRELLINGIVQNEFLLSEIERNIEKAQHATGYIREKYNISEENQVLGQKDFYDINIEGKVSLVEKEVAREVIARRSQVMQEVS